MKLKDNSPMPYGQYKGNPMSDVPGSYLLWLYDNGKAHRGVKEYVQDNIKLLEKEAESERKQRGRN